MPDSNRTKRAPGRPSTRHAKRRDEILRMAAGVFAEKGFHGASMRDIAARLGMRQAALYYYFPSKTGILEAICREGITHFVEKVGIIAAAPLPAEEKLRRALRSHLEPLIEQRFFVHAFLFQRRELPKSVRRPLDAQAHAYTALWRGIVEDGQKKGVIARDLDPELTVLAILGMCNTVARWSRTAAEVGLDRVADSFARLVSHGLFGGEALKPAKTRRTPSRG
ncbi:MAG: TetR family transcriptional regulator [Rhodospirillaceae bacterium]|nr:TetR family transcriptional regulator [Rhodospirillaceae bacterium]